MTPLYRWSHDPHMDVWTKGRLRVSGGLLAVITDKPVRHRKWAAVQKLAQSVSRPKPERATLTKQAKRRILARIRAAGRLTIGSAT